MIQKALELKIQKIHLRMLLGAFLEAFIKHPNHDVLVQEYHKAPTEGNKVDYLHGVASEYLKENWSEFVEICNEIVEIDGLSEHGSQGDC